MLTTFSGTVGGQVRQVLLYIVKQNDDLVQQISTKIWMEACITYLNILPHHSQVTLQKNHEYRQSRHLECNMVNI